MAKFINPTNLVHQVGIRNNETVADFGCGSGFYVLPAAQMVGTHGTVYAVDIMESKLAATQSIAKQMGFHNVHVVRADLEKPLTDIHEGVCDAVMMANILHEAIDMDGVLKNAYRVLKTGGRALVVEWKKEYTPIGPDYKKRIAERDIENKFMRMGFRLEHDLDSSVDSYHYAKVFIK